MGQHMGDRQISEHSLGYFIVKMDKSMCQTYNLKNNFLGYRGIPTAWTKFFLEEIADTHGPWKFRKFHTIPWKVFIFQFPMCFFQCLSFLWDEFLRTWKIFLRKVHNLGNILSKLFILLSYLSLLKSYCHFCDKITTVSLLWSRKSNECCYRAT